MRTLLVVAVAVVLVGPVQEFVIGRSLIGAGARRTPLRLAATELEEMKTYASGRAGT